MEPDREVGPGTHGKTVIDKNINDLHFILSDAVDGSKWKEVIRAN